MNIPRELIDQFARGNGLILIGAGLSQGAGLPSWADLVRELVTELDGCPTDASPRDIAQYYEIEYGRNRLVQRLRNRLDTMDLHPTSVHEALVNLPVSAIFTTNYDDLLERALRVANRPFTPVVGNVDASFWSADRLQLVKLHGDLNHTESIVITAEDYERFEIQRPTLARLLATTFQTRTVLFLGYSATDPDLRLILTQVRYESGQFARNLYTVQFGVPKLTGKDLERRGLKVVDLGPQPDGTARNVTLHEWLQALNQQVTAESQELKPVAPQEPQTAAEMLASEIQIWLNAMGYTVIDQPGNGNYIDLDAALQRGLEEQHVVVRCIAGEITVRHLETLEQDITERSIPKGWAVSDRHIPPSTFAYADTHPAVRPFGLADFVSQIFGPYFDRLRRLIEESDIPRYYVDLACYRRVLDNEGAEVSRDHYEIIDEYVDDWLKARDANHLSILGEFGSGKTWFCRHYAYRQMERYLNDPVHERLPILITLHDYVKQVDVGSLIRKLIDEQGVQLRGGLEAFEELNRQGKLLLIFDGFDEMAVKVDYQAVVDYFWELTKVVALESKALLTCRTPYFRYATEAEKVMHGEELGRQMIVIRPPRFEVVYLEPFADEQIREVITRRRGPEVAEAILSNSDLTELARQPVLIEMLMEALPGIQPGMAISRSAVYRLAVDRWLERDIRTGRTFMSKEDKLFFMMELAWEMLSTGNWKIHYKELPEQINCHFGLERSDEKDHYDYDIRTKSFLRRDAAGHYEFTHKSLAEFLVAELVIQDIENGVFEKLEQHIDSNAIRFIQEMLRVPTLLSPILKSLPIVQNPIQNFEEMDSYSNILNFLAWFAYMSFSRLVGYIDDGYFMDPSAAIRGFLELIRRGMKGEFSLTEEDIDDFSNVIVRNLNGLTAKLRSFFASLSRATIDGDYAQIYFDLARCGLEVGDVRGLWLLVTVIETNDQHASLDKEIRLPVDNKDFEFRLNQPYGEGTLEEWFSEHGVSIVWI